MSEGASEVLVYSWRDTLRSFAPHFHGRDCVSGEKDQLSESNNHSSYREGSRTHNQRISNSLVGWFLIPLGPREASLGRRCQP